MSVSLNDNSGREDSETKAYGESESKPPETLDQRFADIADEHKAFRAGMDFATAKSWDLKWLGVETKDLGENDAFEHYRIFNNDSL